MEAEWGGGTIGKTGEAGDDLVGAGGEGRELEAAFGVGAGAEPELGADEGDGGFADGGVRDGREDGVFDGTGLGEEGGLRHHS